MSDIKIAFEENKETVLKGDDISFETNVSNILSDEFISSHTDFSNLISFLNGLELDYSKQEFWDKIQSGNFDIFIKQHTDYESWEDMIIAAGNELLAKSVTQ